MKLADGAAGEVFFHFGLTTRLLIVGRGQAAEI